MPAVIRSYGRGVVNGSYPTLTIEATITFLDSSITDIGDFEALLDRFVSDYEEELRGRRAQISTLPETRLYIDTEHPVSQISFEIPKNRKKKTKKVNKKTVDNAILELEL